MGMRYVEDNLGRTYEVLNRPADKKTLLVQDVITKMTYIAPANELKEVEYR